MSGAVREAFAFARKLIAGGMTDHLTDERAVRDGDDLGARRRRRAASVTDDPADGTQGPRADVRPRLRSRHLGAVPVAPPCVEVRRAKTLRLAVRALSEIGIASGHPCAQRSGDEVGRLGCAREIAGDDENGNRGVARLAQRRTRLACLVAAMIVERDVGRALYASVAVPVGLAVAHKGEDRHLTSVPARRQRRASANAASTSLVPASIFTVARASARV